MNCKNCGKRAYSELCFRCKPRKPIKKVGKRTNKWLVFRKTLPNIIPPDYRGFWRCHYCNCRLTIKTLTWEHLHGRDGSLLTDIRYIVPCCTFDNMRKGSRSYESYCREFYPELIDNI